MSRHYAELIKARLENVAGAIGNFTKGLIYYRDEAGYQRPYIGDGSAEREILLRHFLSAGTGEQIKVNEGGTNITSLTGNALQFLRVNAGETGYEFSPVSATSDNFAWFFIPTATNVTIPDNQIMYLFDRSVDIEGTLTIDGLFESIVL